VLTVWAMVVCNVSVVRRQLSVEDMASIDKTFAA
jgi:hypothetical protein